MPRPTPLHFDHPGLTAIAPTADFGYGPSSIPASAPDVIALGGAMLCSCVAIGAGAWSTAPAPRRGFIAGINGSVGITGISLPPLLFGCPADFNDVGGGSNGFCQGR